MIDAVATSHHRLSKAPKIAATAAKAYEADASVPVPSTTRLRRPPSRTPLSCRKRASCTPATATRTAMPAARAVSVHEEGSATPTAVEAICTAIAAPIDAKNQDGILAL